MRGKYSRKRAIPAEDSPLGVCQSCGFLVQGDPRVCNHSSFGQQGGPQVFPAAYKCFAWRPLLASAPPAVKWKIPDKQLWVDTRAAFEYPITATEILARQVEGEKVMKGLLRTEDEVGVFRDATTQARTDMLNLLKNFPPSAFDGMVPNIEPGKIFIPVQTEAGIVRGLRQQVRDLMDAVTSLWECIDQMKKEMANSTRGRPDGGLPDLRNPTRKIDWR